jgi:HK97 family phage major capsid protein/HK97 family phage prohead protease
MIRSTAPAQGERLHSDRAVRRSTIDEDTRTARFIASDETVDRYGDIIRATGWKLDNFRNNPVLLFGHQNNETPVGLVENIEVEGTSLVADVRFRPEGDSPRSDDVWNAVKGGFLRAVSVGFMPSGPINTLVDEGGNLTGFEYTSQELFELSVVPVPANPMALAVARSLGISRETQRLFIAPDESAVARAAAMAVRRSIELLRLCVPEDRERGSPMALQKQIAALQAQRNAQLDAMSALALLAEGDDKTPARLFTETEAKDFDKAKDNVADIDKTLARLIEAEKQLALTAKPMVTPLAIIEPEPKKDWKPAYKGQAFTRFCIALALSKNNLMQAVEIAKRWDNETPEVGRVLRHAVSVGNTNEPAMWLQRAAVAAGTTTNATWAAPLVNYTVMNDEFMELLRPATVFGQLTGYRNIPFNVKIPRQTAGATAGWVGEGLSKPVSALAFDQVTVPFAKIAVIVVITQELARFSSPSAEALIRDDLIAAIAQFIDQQLLDPTVTPSAGVRPGSITNGVSAIPSSGRTPAAIITDLTAAMTAMTTGLQSITRPVWLMNAAAAMFLATVRTSQDVFLFPGMTGATTGGAGLNLLGIPVVVSGNVGAGNIILLDQAELMVADDGETLIDTSTEAAVQMDSAPATPPTPLVSFWQQNLLGIKAERFIYWLKRRPAAVQLITGFPAP